MILEPVTKICRETPNLTTMSGTLHEDIIAFRNVGGYVCSATIQTTHCCVTKARLLLFIALLTAIYAREQLLLSHGSSGNANASKCYVRGKLSTLLKLLVFYRDPKFIKATADTAFYIGI